MTENKRFTVRDWQIGMEINDDKTGKDYNRLTDICDLLNELNNENQILPKHRKFQGTA